VRSQLKYLRQFHSLLTDDHIRRSSAFKDLLKLASVVSANLINRLDPEPIALSQSAEERPELEGSDELSDKQDNPGKPGNSNGGATPMAAHRKQGTAHRIARLALCRVLC
jgi:hypothetical protein